ncbi:MAG: SpoIIE family protein phosphatase [Candidatus Delongbacteria bacterium]|nr:SpoIIE family protein phosphatase [Candidatus Delongbacteria bacterium]MBN2836132.1 SpoIIE family protein phosphatase [Candidatus Delongbacteria bacterium]
MSENQKISFNELIENALAPIFVCSSEKIVFVNNSFEVLSGYDKNSLINMQVRQILPELDRPLDYSKPTLSLLTSKLEFKLLNVTKLISNDKSKIVFFCRDETEYNLRNIEAERNKEYLNLIFSTIGDGVVIHDSENEIININNAALKYGVDIVEELVAFTNSSDSDDGNTFDSKMMSFVKNERVLHFSISKRKIIIEKIFEAFVLTISDITKETELNIELDQKKKELEERLNVMNRELELARKVQTEITPDEYYNKNDIFVLSKFMTANNLGGDFFEVRSKTDCSRFGVFDVSGHGVASSLIVMMLKSFLSDDFVSKQHDLSVMFSHIQKKFENKVPGRNFIASTYCLLEEQTLSTICSGSYKPIIYRRDGSVIEVGVSTFPIGLIPNPKFDSIQTEIEEGDIIIIHTDGIVEATNSEDQLFSRERIVDIVKDCPRSPLEIYRRLYSELKRFTGRTEGFDDDITFMVVYYCPNLIQLSYRSFEALLEHIETEIPDLLKEFVIEIAKNNQDNFPMKMTTRSCGKNFGVELKFTKSINQILSYPCYYNENILYMDFLAE